jgi:glycerol transport system ATP-binding protein
MNLLRGEVRGHALVLPGGVSGPAPPHFATLPDGPVTVGVRPHLVTVDGVGAGTGALSVGGELLLAELTGSATYLHVRIGEDEALVAEVPGVHSHPIGELLRLHITPGSLYAFDLDSGELLADPVGDTVAGARG